MRKLLFSRVNKTKLVFAAGLVLAISALSGGVGLIGQASAAPDCDDNAIIKCGFSSPSDFITDVKNNDSKNGHTDLNAVYDHYGLSSGDYDDFAAHAVQGTAERDGDLVVNGQTVGTNMFTIGRIASDQGSGYSSVAIGAKTYYGNSNDQAFKAGEASLPATVYFNDQGAVQFFVLNGCGNPGTVTKVVPSESCKMLNVSPTSGQPNTYNFSTTALVGGNASIAKVVYDFGDGSSQTETNPSTVISHPYRTTGTFEATVTVFVNLPGGNSTTIKPAALCTHTIIVSLPFCSGLAAVETDKQKLVYKFTATANLGTGGTLLNGDFSYDDGTAVQTVTKTTGTTIVVSHTFVKAGNYDVTALLHFTVNGAATSAAYKCAVKLSPNAPPVQECKPGVPVGSPECTPCQYDTSLPSNSPQCVAPLPPTLPNTGAGDTIAIFAAVVIGGFLVYRQLLFRRNKAAFVAAQYGTSPLPLGDPLNDEAPLVDTPLAPKRRSFRRKRPF